MGGLYPAAIDDVALVGDGAGVVGGEKEHEAGDVFWEDVPFERLAGHDFGFVFRRVDQPLLFLGHDGAGKDGVDANVEWAELVGQGSCEADDGGLGRDVERDAGGWNHPGDGRHIDN